jgi:hypothetical protein
MQVTGRDSIYKLCLVQYLHTNEYHKVIVIINSTYYTYHISPPPSLSHTHAHVRAHAHTHTHTHTHACHTHTHTHTRNTQHTHTRARVQPIALVLFNTPSTATFAPSLFCVLKAIMVTLKSF